MLYRCSMYRRAIAGAEGDGEPAPPPVFFGAAFAMDASLLLPRKPSLSGCSVARLNCVTTGEPREHPDHVVSPTTGELRPRTWCLIFARYGVAARCETATA